MKAFIRFFWMAVLAAKHYFLNVKISDEVIRRWVDEVCNRFNIEVECKGEFKGRRFMVLANHESYFDILALYKCSSQHLIWVAKEQLFNMPVVGHALRDLGGVAVDRDDEAKSAKALLKLLKNFKEGAIVIFPQGTRRSRDAFHKGGIFLAKRKNIPIYPVRIEGSKDIVPVGRLALYPGSVKVKIFEKIDVKNFTEEELVKLIRDRIYA